MPVGLLARAQVRGGAIDGLAHPLAARRGGGERIGGRREHARDDSTETGPGDLDAGERAAGASRESAVCARATGAGTLTWTRTRCYDADPALLEIGETLGHHRIVSRLSEGGMATLYLGRPADAPDAPPVAIKVIHEHLSEDWQFVRMFVDEALISVRLRHPNVVRVDELGEHQNVYYLVMEYVHGCSLSQLLTAMARQGRRMRPEIAVWIAQQVAAGLHAAHEMTGHDGAVLGVIHRDVSPQNVLLSVDGEVKPSTSASPRREAAPSARRPASSRGRSATWRRSRPWARRSIDASTSTPSAWCSGRCSRCAATSRAGRRSRCCARCSPPSPCPRASAPTGSIRASIRRCSRPSRPDRSAASDRGAPLSHARRGRAAGHGGPRARRGAPPAVRRGRDRGGRARAPGRRRRRGRRPGARGDGASERSRGGRRSHPGGHPHEPARAERRGPVLGRS
ncbi:MAG: protein kinase [Sandaracinaceae bacterium]|nr:protein kinase [Sandaracinaceae bacterium]